MIKDFFFAIFKASLLGFFFIRIFLSLLHILHCFKILLRKRQENLLNKLGTEVIRARTFLFLILFLHSLIILLFFLEHRGIEALWFVASKDFLSQYYRSFFPIHSFILCKLILDSFVTNIYDLPSAFFLTS